MHGRSSATLVEELQWLFELQEYGWDFIDDGMDTDCSEVARLRWNGHHHIAAEMMALIESAANDKTVSAFPDLVRQILLGCGAHGDHAPACVLGP